VAGETRARLLPFGSAAPDGDGAWVEGDTLRVRWEGADHVFDRPGQLALAGPTGAANALAAIAAAVARGVPDDVIAGALAAFEGVPNRLERVVSCNGVTFINDTSATAPVAAAATIRLLAGRDGALVVIAGGADKASDFTPMAEAVAETGVPLVLLDGTGTARLRQRLLERGVDPGPAHGSLASAFEAAIATAGRPLTVALSPGCASFGMFRNEFDRGEQFRRLARDWCQHSRRG
jgi:UDP-N-acetylmuramoylalanine--D-glutamate ligase